MADFTPNPNLNFEQLWDNSSADLNFGASDSDAPIEIPTVTATGDAKYTFTATASSTASYDANVFRGLIADISGEFQQSKLLTIDKQAQFESNIKLTISTSTDWQQSKLIGTDNQVRFEANVKLQTSAQSLSEQARLVGGSSNQSYEAQTFIAASKQLLNESAKLVGHSQWYSFEAMAKRQIERNIKGEYSELIGRSYSTDNEYTRLIGHSTSILIETAKIPPWLFSPPIIEPDVTFDTSSDLHFSCLWTEPSAWLNFGTKCQPPFKDIEPPTDYDSGVIFVTNSVSLVRSDDGREIKLLGFSVGIDSNSYTWSFSATVPLSELSKVDTAHEQRIGVDFTCNGNLWRFILDDCSDSVSFGESSLTIKGKSRAMLLAHPYAAQRGFKFDTAMSARQIAESELNRNGVPSGFTLDWQLAGVNGWNVPANTYSYTGKTPINSLQWIAEAAGGFINADMSADVLHVLAHYPTPSWEWAAQTPSINLPMSLITSRSRGRINKPAYNGVTLYGENDNGIGALIKRIGTSGGYQPPMVTSDLMTDTAAAISRGKMILSDTGDIGNIGISMPLIADIGVLKPSTLIGVNEGEQWVGMVRGTTITGRLSSNRALEIDQSIDVERHFDKEIV